MEGLNNIPNVDDINKIEFAKDVTLYCPMGQGFYLAKVKVEIQPYAVLMDYLDIEEFFKNLVGKEFIIEQAVAEIYTFLYEGYKPIKLKVSITAVSNIHFPVTVTKY